MAQGKAPGASDTVAEFMICRPKVLSDTATIGDIRDFFLDDHVHAALIVQAVALLSVVERADLDSTTPTRIMARTVGRLDDRVVAATEPLAVARQRMQLSGRRRLAVVNADGELVGLLCLKRSGLGFCSDDDVQARADYRP